MLGRRRRHGVPELAGRLILEFSRSKLVLSQSQHDSGQLGPGFGQRVRVGVRIVGGDRGPSLVVYRPYQGQYLRFERLWPGAGIGNSSEDFRNISATAGRLKSANFGLNLLS